nr:hypothetical protein CFP56_10155 [Quercus suber]
MTMNSRMEKRKRIWRNIPPNGERWGGSPLAEELASSARRRSSAPHRTKQGLAKDAGLGTGGEYGSSFFCLSSPVGRDLARWKKDNVSRLDQGREV